MKKSIYLLLVSTIMSSPLHAGTAGSVPMIRDVLDEQDVQESEYVKVPRVSLQKLQQRNEELEKENNEIKQRTKVEEVKEKREEPEEASLSSSFSSLSFENQGSEILLDREEELKKAKSFSIFLQREKERKGKDPEEASSSSTSSFSSENQERKAEAMENWLLATAQCQSLGLGKGEESGEALSPSFSSSENQERKAEAMENWLLATAQCQSLGLGKGEESGEASFLEKQINEALIKVQFVTAAAQSSLEMEKEKKGKEAGKASSSSISSTSALSSEKQVGKTVEIEEKGMKPKEDTPASPSSDLSFEKSSSQPWLYSKLTGVSSSITGTLDAWFPDFAFERKIKEAGFDPQLIDLYKKFSPTFEKLAQYRSDEVIQYKSLISKELFKGVLINIRKDLPLLLKASVDLAEDIGIYTFSGRDYTVDPYMYYAEWLYDGIGGFKKDEKEAFAVMHKYGSAGHEGVRRMHLLKSYRAFSGGSKENLMYFQNTLQEYIEKNSEVATKIAKCFTNKVTDRQNCTVMQLTISDLNRVTLEDLRQTTASNCLKHLSKEKQEQIDRILSLFKGEKGYKKDPQKASQLSVEYGIFLAPSAAIKYQQ